MLTSGDFLVPLVYGCLFMVFYAALVYILLKNRKAFNSYFYTIYILWVITNFFAFINQYIIFRLPQHTCETCMMADFFREAHFAGMEILNFCYVHIACLRHSINLLFALNRINMIYDPIGYDKTWKKYGFIMVFMAYFLPATITYGLITGDSTYTYVVLTDSFQVRSTAYTQIMFEYIFYYSLVMTAFCLLLNLITVYKLYEVRKMTMSESRWEHNLTYMTFFTFGWQTLDVIRHTVNNQFIDHISREGLISKLMVIMEPYLFDMFTVFPPITLVLFSSTLRQHLYNTFIRISSSNKVGVTSVRTVQ